MGIETDLGSLGSEGRFVVFAAFIGSCLSLGVGGTLGDFSKRVHGYEGVGKENKSSGLFGLLIRSQLILLELRSQSLMECIIFY